LITAAPAPQGTKSAHCHLGNTIKFGFFAIRKADSTPQKNRSYQFFFFFKYRFWKNFINFRDFRDFEKILEILEILKKFYKV
jgi:hypothetical protein